MSAADQERWDARYLDQPLAAVDVPAGFVAIEAMLPLTGRALDVACGAGGGSVWLAERGLDVVGVDGSSVAIAQANLLAAEEGVSSTCHFVVADLDAGLPPGPAVDLLTCHLFSAQELDTSLVDRLAPGGVLAITVLSEVGGEPGPYRAPAGALVERFSALEVLFHLEHEGRATLAGRLAGPEPTARLD